MHFSTVKFNFLNAGICAACVSSSTIAAPLEVDRIKGLCAAIASKLQDDDPRSCYMYKYQRILHRAAGAEIAAPECNSSNIDHKVRDHWNAGPNLCNIGTFEGLALSYAVRSFNQDALIDLAIIYRVNLNELDPKTGGTVLDYIDRQVTLSQGNDVLLTDLQKYRRIVEKAGGSRARELKP